MTWINGRGLVTISQLDMLGLCTTRLAVTTMNLGDRLKMKLSNTTKLNVLYKRLLGARQLYKVPCLPMFCFQESKVEDQKGPEASEDQKLPPTTDLGHFSSKGCCCCRCCRRRCCCHRCCYCCCCRRCRRRCCCCAFLIGCNFRLRRSKLADVRYLVR